MARNVREAVLDEATQNGQQGTTMGAIVDALEHAGQQPETVELVIWQMLQEHVLVPSGFVCKTVRKRDEAGTLYDVRTYEFLLVPADQLEQTP